MAKAPIIDSPCPFSASETPQAGRDHCGHCDRKVHNLDGMSTQQREHFMRSCTGKVCVAYTVHRAAPRRNLALGATLVAALSGTGMAMAQQVPPLLAPEPAQHSPVTSDPSVTIVEPSQLLTVDSLQLTSVVMGGVLNPGDARWAEESELGASPQDELPTIGQLEWLPSKEL